MPQQSEIECIFPPAFSFPHPFLAVLIFLPQRLILTSHQAVKMFWNVLFLTLEVHSIEWGLSRVYPSRFGVEGLSIKKLSGF